MLDNSIISGFEENVSLMIFQLFNYATLSIFSFIPTFDDIYNIINYKPDDHGEKFS